jgi:hypothetical protein
MDKQMLHADYLVIGSGAVAMSFVDVIVSESNATVVMVDRHHGPGGHWNDAYPFVRLHQPSAYYGVNSKALGTGGADDRATGSEMVAYYEQVMAGFLQTGRVRYFPMCDYTGDFAATHTFHSLTASTEYQVTVNRKIVDTTYLKTAVPSTHPPKYSVEAGVRCIPVNQLPHVREAPTGYCVVGSGKTGIDAVLWLLDNAVSRDAWYQNRANAVPGMEHFEHSYGAVTSQYEAIGQASSVSDLLHRLNAAEVLLRIDDQVEPTMYHGATMSQAELHKLRTVKNVVRMGRVRTIALDRVELDRGTIPADSGWLFVDCSASAVAKGLPMLPVFDGPKITPQFVRLVQPTFSAALIAHIELQLDDEDVKNEICTAVPIPDVPADWLRMFAVNTVNQQRWRNVDGLSEWMAASRLDGFSSLASQVDPGDKPKIKILQRLAAALGPAVENLPRLLESVSTT